VITGDAEPGPQPGRREYAWRDPRGGGAGKTGRKGSEINPKKALAVILGFVLAASAGFGGGMAAMSAGGSLNLSAATPNSPITINPTDQVGTTEAVAAKVIPTVVGITSTVTREVDAFPFGFGSYSEEMNGVGTGIIVDESGYILTNSHVVRDGEAGKITVLLPDSREVEGQVLWYERRLDLAIVKVEATGLKAATLGDSDSMNIGSYVAAIGNPLGLEFRSSISQGVISGLDRTIVTSDASDYSSAPVQMEGLFQVDAAINQGNSGGPLVNSKGEVIGINTAKTQSGEGMGFAIPINTAKPIVESVKRTGEFHRVYIGVSTRDVAEIIESYPNVDLGVKTGAFVSSVTPGSPAEYAGLLADDIIVKLNGKDVKSSSDLIKQLLGYSAGDKVEITLMRDKQTKSFTVTLTDSLEYN
jgi:S1-C subfamily serine protease